MSQQKNRREKGVTVSPYDNGKGKPPKSGQIKPGEVRNPKGRPKKPKVGGRGLNHFLDEKVTIDLGGGPREFTKRELMYNQLANRAAKGELRAIKVVMDHDREASAGRSADPLLFDPALTEALLHEMRNSVPSDECATDRHADKSRTPDGGVEEGAGDGSR